MQHVKELSQLERSFIQEINACRMLHNSVSLTTLTSMRIILRVVIERNNVLILTVYLFIIISPIISD